MKTVISQKELNEMCVGGHRSYEDLIGGRITTGHKCTSVDSAPVFPHGLGPKKVTAILITL